MESERKVRDLIASFDMEWRGSWGTILSLNGPLRGRRGRRVGPRSPGGAGLDGSLYTY